MLECLYYVYCSILYIAIDVDRWSCNFTRANKILNVFPKKKIPAQKPRADGDLGKKNLSR
jgi:hypothetical protein